MTKPKQTKNEAIRAAYLAGYREGFLRSGEGYNAEYPFGDKRIDLDGDHEKARNFRADETHAADGYMASRAKGAL